MPGTISTPSEVHLLTAAWDAEIADYIICMEWSRDGSVLAVASLGGPIMLFERGGRFLRELPGGTQSISWSADGRLLASGGQDGFACIWEVSSGRKLHRLAGGADWVEHVAFSPKKDYLLTAAGRFLKLWNAEGALLRAFPLHPSTISDVQWQRDSLYFATGAYGQLGMFHAEKPEFSKLFAWKGSILVVAWSPDSNYIATGNQDASVHFWYRKTGKDLEMSGYPAKVRELDWDPKSRFLATGGSELATIWDCDGNGPAGTKPIQLEAHQRFLTVVAFDPEGPFLATGCQAGRVYVWNYLRRRQLPLRGADLSRAITQIRWTPDGGMLAAAAESGSLRVFNRPEREI